VRDPTSSVLVLTLAGALAGCFEASFADGEIACGEAGCPPGMSCAGDGFCYRDPAPDPGGDSGGDPGDSNTELVLAIGHDDGVRLYAMCGAAPRLVWTAPAGPEARQLAWGDLDGDGIPELAAANLRGAAVIFQRGREGFLERARLADTAPSRAIVLFDVDRDGDDDLAVGHADGPLRLYRANGGALESVWSSANVQPNWELAAGDYDGDSDLDLAVALNGPGDQVYRNDDGALSLMWTNPVVGQTEAVSWGDVDGDGRWDLASAGTDVRARVHRFDGASFVQLWESPMDRDDAEALAFSDYDRDGLVDLGVGNWDDPDRVFRNVNGTLMTAWSSESKSNGQGGGNVDGTESLTWIDYDGDGDDDLHLGRHGDSDLLLRNDKSAFTRVWSSPERDGTRAASWLRWQRPVGYASLCD
jgi:hypothetical protein